MAQGNVGQMVPSLQQLFARDDGVRRFLEAVIQQVMSVEVQEHLRAARHERAADRTGYRNGSKPKSFKTRVGELALEIPQVRGCEPYRPGLFNKWQRSELSRPSFRFPSSYCTADLFNEVFSP